MLGEVLLIWHLVLVLLSRVLLLLEVVVGVLSTIGSCLGVESRLRNASLLSLILEVSTGSHSTLVSEVVLESRLDVLEEIVQNRV